MRSMQPGKTFYSILLISYYDIFCKFIFAGSLSQWNCGAGTGVKVTLACVKVSFWRSQHRQESLHTNRAKTARVGDRDAGAAPTRTFLASLGSVNRVKSKKSQRSGPLSTRHLSLNVASTEAIKTC